VGAATGQPACGCENLKSLSGKNPRRANPKSQVPCQDWAGQRWSRKPNHRREALCQIRTTLTSPGPTYNRTKASAPELAFVKPVFDVNNFFHFPLCAPENFLTLIQFSKAIA
jgi:hypothetical protein